MLAVAQEAGVIHEQHAPTPAPTQAVHDTPVAPDPPRAVGDPASIICAPQYAWDCGTALAIVHCESRFDPWAVGKAGEVGIWQIHPVHQRGAIDHDPYISTEYAYHLWLAAGGFSDWSCAGGGY